MDLGVIAVVPNCRRRPAPQEPEWHPRATSGHNLQVIDRARTRIDDSATSTATRRDARRGLPPTSASRRPQVHRRTHTLARSRGTGRRAGRRVFDRLNVNACDGYDVRKQVLGITAHTGSRIGFKVRRRGRRRRAFRALRTRLIRSCSRGSRSRTAKAAARATLTAPRWMEPERARGARVQHRPPDRSCSAATCSGWGPAPSRRDSEGRLRATGWTGPSPPDEHLSRGVLNPASRPVSGNGTSETTSETGPETKPLDQTSESKPRD
jgi:hypothetical protein